MKATTGSNRRSRTTFRHEALFYAGQDEFVGKMTTFIRDGLQAEEPVLVVVIPPKIDLLRDALGGDSKRVLFGDMAEIGRNPSRIIPVWRDFVDKRANGRAVRGIGEPIWAGRTPEETEESQRHESLINLAFVGAPAWIVCPYDEEALHGSVIDEALRSHPVITLNGSKGRTSEVYRGLEQIARPFDAPLPEPPEDAIEFEVEPGRLESLRRIVTNLAVDLGLGRARTNDLVISVNELATNSLRHGGGRGTFRAWNEDDAIVAEMRDGGHIGEPLVGRKAPLATQDGGLGLWIVNQLCDLVQLRSYPTGSVVRIRITRH